MLDNLQQEPLNPVVIIKDGITYPPDNYKALEPPFLFLTKHIRFHVFEGYTPVYFKRKTLKVSNCKCELADIKYAIGSSITSNRDYYFVDSKGELVEVVSDKI